MSSSGRQHAATAATDGEAPTGSEQPASGTPRIATGFERASVAGETRRGQFGRRAHRFRLHSYAIAAVALVAYLVALGASNTGRVRVDWVFGSSHVALIWPVLFAVMLGWLLGLAVASAFHWRTRAPRRGGRGS